MIKALELAIEQVATLSPERQEHAAQILRLIAEAGDEVYDLTPEESRWVDEGLAELDRHEYASEAEVRAVYDKYR